VDYRFEALDLADDSEHGRTRRRGWLQAVHHGFHRGKVDDDFEKLWLAHIAADRIE
jgi:hypothetical protein